MPPALDSLRAIGQDLLACSHGTLGVRLGVVACLNPKTEWWVLATRRRGHVMRRWPVTYVDLLRWALAGSTRQRFSAEPVKWHQFVFEAKEAFPAAFKHVIFDLRDESRPFSDQADHALHVFAQAGTLSVSNPTFGFILMAEEQKRAALAAKADDFEEHRTTVQTLTGLAENILAA